MLPSLLICASHLGVVVLASMAIGRFIFKATGTLSKSDSHSNSVTVTLDLNNHFPLSSGFAAALGLGILSYAIFALVQAGMISSKNLSVLWGILTLFAGFEIKTFFRQRKQEPFLSQWPAALGLLLGIYLFWIFLWATLPATDRDEMIYHLEIPRQWLQPGGRTFFQDNVYAYFPQMGETLMLFGLGTAGEWAAKLYQGVFGFFLCAAIYEFSRQQKISRPLCLAAVLFFLSSPVVLVTLPLAYADILYALYVFLAVTAVLRFQENLETKWILIAGVMAGFACCTKFTGFQFLILLSVLILGISWQHRQIAQGFRNIFYLNLMAGILVSPYLLRNFLQTGWPLMPFQIFNLPLNPLLNWDAQRARLYLEWLGTFRVDGRIGPLFMLTPFFLIKTPLTQAIKSLLIFSSLFLYYWFSTTRQSRFLIPLIPFLSILLAWGLDQKKNILFRIVAGVFLIWNFALGIRELWTHDPVPFWLGRETREQYLQRHIPQFGIYQEANARLKVGATLVGALSAGRGQAPPLLYLINMKNYGYYLEVPWRGDFIFERYELNRDFEPRPSQGILQRFFSERGVTYLLIDEGYLAAPGIGFKPEALKVFHEFLARRAKLLTRDHSFALYQLKNLE